MRGRAASRRGLIAVGAVQILGLVLLAGSGALVLYDAAGTDHDSEREALVSLSHATGTFYGAVLLVLSVGMAVVLYVLLRRALADSKIATMTLVVLEVGATSVATLALVFGGPGWLLVLLPAAIGTALAALTLVRQTEPAASPAWPRV